MNPDQSVSSCAISEVGHPLSAKNNAAEKVFSNTVVWRKIGSYLNVGDLKACRLVNSGFHAMVMKETNFLQRCVVSLKPDQITRNNFGSTSELWKNVLLKFQSLGEGSNHNFSDQDLQNLDWLFPIITNVQSLSLRMKKGTKVGNLSPLFKRLLLAPKKLRSLAMDPIFLVSATGGSFEDLKEVLGNLEELEILEPSPESLLDVEGWEDIDPSLVSPDFVKQLKHLRVAKSYYLQTLVFALPLRVSSPATFLEGEILTSVLTRIAHQSCKTLEHLTLGESRILKQKWAFPPLPFAPNAYTPPGTVTKFFETMPMLQELDFLVCVLHIPIEVFNWMEKRSTCLRKVKLQSFDLHYYGNKWACLEQTNLEELQLVVFNHGYYSKALPNEPLSYLPSTIRRLILRGPLEANPAPALTRLNPTLVTQLTFIDSGKCFGDNVLKYIRENFGMLRKLNVTNAEMVTDAGFIGSSSGESSMSGMKGLRTLILRECGSITDATLREIRFLELSYLDLAYNDKLTEDGFERVLSSNPSLETLITSCKDVYRKREHLYASHPRLSSVMYRGLKAKKTGIRRLLRQ